jgi:Ser/Thr protein kinase RdoA (MazF antagonist)
MSTQHIKRYATSAARKQAEANYRWLAGLPGPARLPELHASGDRELRFEHIEGRHARPGDLTMLAAHLGTIHGSAFASALHAARLQETYRAPGGPELPAFPARRLNAVERELSAHPASGAGLTIAEARQLITSASGPAAFYKDANPRNFLITPAGTPVTIDFDDLTLAPFGYDLAKLIVTLSMTYGPIPASAAREALTRYNAGATRHAGSEAGVTWDELMTWAELHYVLTSRYAADGQYPRMRDKIRPA